MTKTIIAYTRSLFMRHGIFHKTAIIVFLLLSFDHSLRAQSGVFKVLYNFTNNQFFTNRSSIPNGVILSSNVLYGTAVGISPPASQAGSTVFRINADGSGFTNLHYFTGQNDGGLARGAPLLISNQLYGATEIGNDIFAINTDGSGLTNIAVLSRIGYSAAALIASGNTLFGTGTGSGVFAVNTDGTGYTNLATFTGTNGSFPAGTLALSGDTLYGTAYQGGISNNGTVFAVTTNGSSFTNLHIFTGTDGGAPYCGLVLGGNTLFGTTTIGGSGSNGTVFAINVDGTGFTNLYSFNGNDGSQPFTGLTLSGDTLYGVTEYGGINGTGEIFGINTNGSAFTILHSFQGAAGEYLDGANPCAPLVLAGNIIYGVACHGGTTGDGTLFSLTLAPPLWIALTNGPSVVLSWPSWATNYVLQSTTNLASGTWTNMTNSISMVGTNWIWTNTLASQAAFFRLEEQ